MINNFNSFDCLETPILTLCNPNCIATIETNSAILSSAIGNVINPSGVSLKLNFNAQSELNFDICLFDNGNEDDKKENDQMKYIYYQVQKDRYIYVEDVGFFIITNVSDKWNDSYIKTITCNSVDKELENYKVPELRDSQEQKDVVIDIVTLCRKLQACMPMWTIDHIDNSLIYDNSSSNDGVQLLNQPNLDESHLIYRNFEDDNIVDATIYDFLLNSVQDAFQCIIEFDYIGRKISIYDRTRYALRDGVLTDIYLSKHTILNNLTVEEDGNEVYTALDVKSSDDKLHCRYANPNGLNVLYDFTWFKKWMSDGLRTAITHWEDNVDYYLNDYQYTNNGTTYTGYKEINRLFTNLCDAYEECLANETVCQVNLDEQNNLVTNLKNSPEGSVVDAGQSQTRLQLAINQQTACQTALNTAKTNSNNALARRNIVQGTIDHINTNCSFTLQANIHGTGTKIFTQPLLDELSVYIKQCDYSEEYITITEDDNYSVIFDKSCELYDKAKEQLEKVSSGSKKFSIDNNSFVFNKEFIRFSNQLKTGCIISLETEVDDSGEYLEGNVEQLFLLDYEINYDDKKVTFTFGNKFNKYDIKSLFDDFYSSVKKSASSLKYQKDILTDAVKDVSEITSVVDDVLNLTGEKVLSAQNQSITIDEYGLLAKRQETYDDNGVIKLKFDEQNRPVYSPKQLKIVNNCLALTETNWTENGNGQTIISTAIGELQIDENTTTYGVIGQTIIGKLLLGNSLKITNSNNDSSSTITIDGSGINIRKFQNNTYTNVFNADTNGNLSLTGTVNALAGSIGGFKINGSWLYGGSNSPENCSIGISGSDSNYSIVAGYRGSGTTGSNRWNFYVTPSGYLCCRNGTFTGTINANTGSIGGFNINSGWLWSGGTSQNDCHIGITADEQYFAFVAGYKGNSTLGVNRWYYRVTPNGELYAEKGQIGGFNIGSNFISDMNGIAQNGSNIGFTTDASSGYYMWAGYISGQSGYNRWKFFIDDVGDMYCKNAHIQGSISASTISGSTITGGSISISTPASGLFGACTIKINSDYPGIQIFDRYNNFCGAINALDGGICITSNNNISISAPTLKLTSTFDTLDLSAPEGVKVNGNIIG